MGEMSFDGGSDEGKNIATLLPTTFNHRQHRLHKSTAPYALSAAQQKTLHLAADRTHPTRQCRPRDPADAVIGPMLEQLAGGASQAMPKVFRLAVAGQHGWPNSASRNSAVRRLL